MAHPVALLWALTQAHTEAQAKALSKPVLCCLPLFSACLKAIPFLRRMHADMVGYRSISGRPIHVNSGACPRPVLRGVWGIRQCAALAIRECGSSPESGQRHCTGHALDFRPRPAGHARPLGTAVPTACHTRLAIGAFGSRPGSGHMHSGGTWESRACGLLGHAHLWLWRICGIRIAMRARIPHAVECAPGAHPPLCRCHEPHLFQTRIRRSMQVRCRSPLPLSAKRRWRTQFHQPRPTVPEMQKQT